MERRVTPNFFIVGAPKTGTTSLYRYLGQHPFVYTSPIKEPCFFAPEVVDEQIAVADAAALRAYLDGPMLETRPRGFVTEWQQYLKLFKHARDETAIGEASTAYLASGHAPGAIRSRIPEARIIMMLRDPVDRLFSHYKAARAARVTNQQFVPWAIDQVASDAARRPPGGAAWAGRYGSHAGRYLELFSHAQVHVCLFEDYLLQPQVVLRELLDFLGVEEDWEFDLRERLNVTKVRRWPLLHRALIRPLGKIVRPVVPSQLATRAREWSMRPSGLRPTREERAQIQDLYEEDIHILEGLIHRDLSMWLGRSSIGDN